MTPKRTVSTCHPHEPHFAKGFCRRCYSRRYSWTKRHIDCSPQQFDRLAGWQRHKCAACHEHTDVLRLFRKGPQVLGLVCFKCAMVLRYAKREHLQQHLRAVARFVTKLERTKCTLGVVVLSRLTTSTSIF